MTGAMTLICVVDDEEEIRGALDSLLRSAGYQVRTYDGPEAYLASAAADAASCLILDIRLQGANGLDFQQQLLDSDVAVPVIFITGHADIPMTVRGMKAGAVDFIAKPFDDDHILAAVREAVARDSQRRKTADETGSTRTRFETLSAREREIMALVTAGLMNKQVAGRLGLSEITVKIHRSNLMKKMAAQSLADLVRMAESLGVRDASASRYPSMP